MTRPKRNAAPGELTDDQRRELLGGFPHTVYTDPAWSSAFDNLEAKREAWEAHRDDLLPAYIARNPGSRPTAWWEFEAADGWGRYNGACSTTNDLPPAWSGYSVEVGNLVALDALTDGERAKLRARGPLWGPGTSDPDASTPARPRGNGAPPADRAP